MTKEGRESKLMAATMATATNSMPDAWAERMSLEVAHKAGADSIPPPCLLLRLSPTITNNTAAIPPLLAYATTRPKRTCDYRKQVSHPSPICTTPSTMPNSLAIGSTA